MCDICCEPFSKSVRKEIFCEHSDCEFSCCKSCIRTYLTSISTDPHCMSCKKPWSDEFLVENTSKAFCHKELKEHRKKLILEKELSKMPETMQFVEQEIQIRKIQKNIDETETLIKKAQDEISKLYTKRSSFTKQIKNMKNHDPESSTERKKFIMCCRNGDCRGFLSTQLKCELCEVYTCSECLEVIGKDKNQPHTCNPDNVASAQFIKKDTKPCPKCGTRIHKIAGCSQMWCTQCQVAFDYNTLKIDSGPIHNPEYFRFLKENNTNMPRNPQDVVCGGLVHFHSFNQVAIKSVELYFDTIKQLNKNNIDSLENNYGFMQNLLYIIYAQISHTSLHVVPRLRARVTELLDNRKERVAYMMKDITKEELSSSIYSKEKKRKKERELLDVYELLNTVGIETLNSLYQDTNEFKVKFHNITGKKSVEKIADKPAATEQLNNYLTLVKEKITILNNLRIYCNDRFSKISKTYNHNVVLIDEKWTRINLK